MDKVRGKDMDAKYKFLRFKRDWADELDGMGCCLMTAEEYELWHSAIESVKDLYSKYYFGTNEGWEDETIGALVDDIVVKDASMADAVTLRRLFPGIDSYGWGTACPFRILLDVAVETLDDNAEDMTPELKVYMEWCDANLGSQV